MLIDSFALYLAVVPLTVVAGPIAPFVEALALFQAVFEFAFVDVAVAPVLYPVTLWLILLPTSLVVSTRCPGILAYALSLVINPVSFIPIAIRMDKLALSIGNIGLKASLVDRPIGPLQHPKAILLPIFKMPRVEDPRLIFHRAVAVLVLHDAGDGIVFVFLWVFACEIGETDLLVRVEVKAAFVLLCVGHDGSFLPSQSVHIGAPVTDIRALVPHIIYFLLLLKLLPIPSL